MRYVPPRWAGSSRGRLDNILSSHPGDGFYCDPACLERRGLEQVGTFRIKLPTGTFDNVAPAHRQIMKGVRGKGNRTTEVPFQAALVRSGLAGWPYLGVDRNISHIIEFPRFEGLYERLSLFNRRETFLRAVWVITKRFSQGVDTPLGFSESSQVLFLTVVFVAEN